MTITHHLDDATILAYAAGTLGEAHGFAVATHIAFCPTCRAGLREAEGLGGGILADVEPAAVSDSCRSATLASLDAAMAVKPRAPVANHSEMPAVLHSLVGNLALDEIRWKKKGPGIATFDIPLTPGGRTHLQLLKVAAGRKLPEHGHGGEELTVVLRGSYSDHTGRYVRGDVADLDEEIEHRPVVDAGGECICLIATEAPTKFKSFWARLAQPFVGV